MTLLKKISYVALALSIGAYGVYGFRGWDAKRQKEIKELKAQQKTLAKNLSELEKKLKIQGEESAKNGEETSKTFDSVYQEIKAEGEYFAQKINELYQNHDLLRTNLEELANGLREENLSQEKKIALLNKYAAVVGVVVNKENEKIKELIKKDENLEGLVNEVGLKVEDFKTTVLEASAKAHEQENSERYQKIIAPTVRLSCNIEIGSGEVIYSKKEGETFYNYVLTAGHVASGAREGRPIQVSVFSDNNNAIVDFGGELIDSSEKLDIAVVEIKSDAPLFSVNLASREEINNVQRFDDIYAVGCPLGYSPVQTEGEITSKNKVLGGETYWLASAQTIFGNSGGGIFLKENNKMIGILTRVSAYNNFVNIAVPHLGFVVSGDKILEWLKESNLQFLYDSSVSREECFRMRAQARRRAEPRQEINDPNSVRNVLK